MRCGFVFTGLTYEFGQADGRPRCQVIGPREEDGGLPHMMREAQRKVRHEVKTHKTGRLVDGAHPGHSLLHRATGDTVLMRQTVPGTETDLADGVLFDMRPAQPPKDMQN